ncbi:hypothetical protein [Methylobacterium sp. WL6]|uniref:hypothetical protein n=1 Tax=Methylobacterium sp. WL6 TaxID=2603901 RepID=UPI0011CAE779|nr:hypothetical protein [Methylobacterium sp. WL6]TXN71987.1 hypothetical protein FV230_06550 [Methylobacterium sp. WL6]
MSVDLVGSTAFKAKHGDKREDAEPYPTWLNRTKNFYRLFPQILSGHFVEFLGVLDGSDNYKNYAPQVWKTVGDEIIFCVRVTCLEHLACCVRAFIKALATYGESINTLENELDVKGRAWIASFPAPNVTIVSASRAPQEASINEVGGRLYEEDELQADVRPGNYDFLGKQIDTGFRISKFAQTNELALSIDLAWLLTLLRQRNLIDCQFTFRGREALKGVIGGVPYPIITAQTERSVKRRELEALERTVSGAGFAEHVGLRNYLYSFMEQNKVEIPIISMHTEVIDNNTLPRCYDDLKKAWAASYREDEEKDKNQDEADAFKDDPTTLEQGTSAAEDEINSIFDKFIHELISKKSD